MDDDWDYGPWPPVALSVDFEWRLVRLVDRILEEQPELREPLEWALLTERLRRSP